ncbi:response regulator transcription factor [Brevibacillus sp. NRS-1366]|uniref:response regulator transcription factor n=1 Tax=Brevibacillus sp. NRS-1366 TaxID=3233899 RepID=UPI003D1D38EE
MKVVIAGDEEHVCKGIDLAVNWDQFGIIERFMADDGYKAMEMIRQHHPAILLCDMGLPRMDEVNLLRLVREEGWNTQVIVVSGSDDYSYIRTALLANVVDYILKPFKTKELEDAVSRAITAYQQITSKAKDEVEISHRLRLADSLLTEQKLAGFLKGEAAFQDHSIRNLFDKIGLPLQGLRVSCFIPRNINQLVYERFMGDIELFKFVVNNITQEILQSFGEHYLCKLDHYQGVLLASSTNPERNSNEFSRQLEKLVRAWRETLGLEVLQGTYVKVADYSQLLPAIAGARASLLKQPLFSGNVPHTCRELPRLQDLEIPLMDGTQKGKKPYLADIIEAFVQSLRSHGSLRFEELQLYTIEANLLLKRTASLCQMDAHRTDFFLPLWISDLDEWKTQLIHRYWGMAEKFESDQSFSLGMEAVRLYIRQHYQENISLSTLSEIFHFSPQYLAKKFKEQFHTTIITYLTDLRIDKAKSLLLHSDTPISELAYSIGYEDEGYFGKVFKKQTGLSPIHFRKRNRNR